MTQLFLANSNEISQEHRLQLNPQLIQSMSVLCMNSAELEDYIDRLYKENPCIERTEISLSGEMMEILSRYRDPRRTSAVSKASGDYAGGPVNVSEASRRYVDEFIESFSYTVKSQLEALHLDQRLDAVCKYLADLLEDNGWLLRESIDSVRKLGIPEDLVDEAVRTIRSLEPAGVGASDASEFIRLQLERYYPGDKLAYEIADTKLLDQLAKGQYKAIALKLRASEQDIRQAAERISSLNAAVLQESTAKEEPVFIRPDVYVYMDGDGRPAALVNEYDHPGITVNQKYLEMYKTTDDASLKEYLGARLKETYSLISSVDRRKSTLQRCFESLIESQRDFFSGGTDALKPFTMAEMAKTLGVNASTVSRALMNKYVQCPKGLFPAKYFFSKRITAASPGGDEKSAQGARAEIVKMVEAEDREHPLSDARICEGLKDLGYILEKRTVTKYRNALSIPDYRMRKSAYRKRKP